MANDWLNNYATSDSAVATISYGNTDGIGSCYKYVSAITDTYVTTADIDKKINEAMSKKPEVSPETTTKLNIKNGKVFVKHYKDGYFKSERCLMSDIADIDVYGQTVVVTFADKTKTSAALDNEDIFSLEQGISICITKKLLGENGSSLYNKLIKRALKLKHKKEEAAKKAQLDKEEAKRRKEAAAIKRNKKKLKRRNEQVSIYKDAIIEALQYMGFKK